MFELQNSGENRRIRSEIFFENLPRAYKDLMQVKKNSKLFHACVPLKAVCNEKEGRSRKWHTLEIGLMAIEVFFSSNFAVVFSLIYFRFRHVKQN
jgi:hypothetical protein